MSEYSDNDKTHTHIVLTKGTMVNHYRIVERIGAGGMGEVYLAEDSNLDRQVALKFMPSHLATDAEARTRFTREAQAAARLDHPNIVPIYEVGEHRGRPYIAMAHVEGSPLNDLVKEGKLSVSETVDLITHICEGLNEAHAAGIVHRDVKPGNIVIDTKGRPRLLDFGLATVPGEDRLTKTGSTLGTVGYMAPEQIMGERVDKRTDLFSVGVILYEMITGRRPFSGDNDAATIKAITDSTPEPIARFKSGTTGELQRIIDKALAKDPSTRYQNADDLIADLKRLGLETTKSRGNRGLIWASAAVIVLVAGYFGVSQFMKAPREPASTEPPVIIVLPFTNLGAETEEFFSDGIRDEIGSRLSTVEGLRVIWPRTADAYKGTDKNIRQIGEETGADYVLEATIRWDKSGPVDRFRITPRLTKTTDSYLMWAENYEKQLVQVFEVQSEIADRVVTALGLTLLEPNKNAPGYAPTTSMQAYNYYLRGIDIMSQGVFSSNLGKAIEMLDSAIAIDPDFALAWAKKSFVHSRFDFTTSMAKEEHHEVAALEAARKALELAPDLPDAHIALGWYYNFVERDYERALAEFAKAKSEVQSNAALSEAIGVVKMRQGKWTEALGHLEEAARLDPLTVRRYYWLSVCHTYLRQYDQSRALIDQGLALTAVDYEAIYHKLLINLLQYGTVDSDEETFEQIVARAGAAAVSSYELASSAVTGFWRFVIDRVDPEQMIANVRALRQQRSDHRIFMNVGHLFELAGQKDSAQLYYDSARISLLSLLELDDEDFHVQSELGLAYAYLGKKDSAILAGKRGKALMTVDDCHW